MKQYVFTKIELMVIRDALIEHWQNTKMLNPKSPIAKDMKSALWVLKDQFKEDVALSN